MNVQPLRLCSFPSVSFETIPNQRIANRRKSEQTVFWLDIKISLLNPEGYMRGEAGAVI